MSRQAVPLTEVVKDTGRRSARESLIEYGNTLIGAVKNTRAKDSEATEGQQLIRGNQGRASLRQDLSKTQNGETQKITELTL